MEMINTRDFEKEAQHKLTQSIYDFIAGGAGDEYTMNRNIEAFKQIHLVPQIFRSSSDTNTTIPLLNHRLSHPFMGNRERDKRNRFKWQAPFTSTQSITSAFLAESNVKQTTDALFASDLSWDDIEWLKAQTCLLIILKGIMHEKDAEIAINLDIAALIISNHGGRQLDYMPSTIHYKYWEENEY